MGVEGRQCGVTMTKDTLTTQSHREHAKARHVHSNILQSKTVGVYLHFTEGMSGLPVHKAKMALLAPNQHVAATAAEVYVVRAQLA